MLRLILILLVLVVSVWVGLLVVQHPGYLILVYQPWMVKMPLWLAILGAVIFLVLFYLIIDSIDRLNLLGYRIKNWFRFRREHQYYSKTQLGMAALIEGNWKSAEQLLLAGTHQSLEPLINYLGAARAAHEQGAFDRRDKYIQEAYKIAPKAEIAIGLTQAELQIKQQHFEQAQANLQRLRELSPKHPRVLKLLEKVYVHQADWGNLHLLMPALRKAKVLTPEQTEIFEKNIFCELFRSTHIDDLDHLKKLWNEVPRSLKKNPEVVYEYVNQLIKLGGYSEAENLIKKTIQYQWHPGLVNLYSQLPFENLNRQLVIGGAWLKTHGDKPEILTFLGKTCVKVQLWGKAKDYFEKSLSINPSRETFLEYGNLLNKLGDYNEASEKFRQGLIEAQTDLPTTT